MWRCPLYAAVLHLAGQFCLPAVWGDEPEPSSSTAAKEIRIAAVQMRSTRDLEANVNKIEAVYEYAVASVVRESPCFLSAR